MSDDERLALARRAGNGDLHAGRRLVALLEREHAVAPGEDPAVVPSAQTGDEELDSVLAEVDELVRRAFAPTGVKPEDRAALPHYVRPVSRLLPRPGEPGARLIGGALHAGLASTSTPRFGWAWDYWYFQVTALAVTVDGTTTLGFARTNWTELQYRSSPPVMWPELGPWTLLPRERAHAALNEDVPSAPLCLRLSAWARKWNVGPLQTRVRFHAELAPRIVAYLHGSSGSSSWDLFRPHRLGAPGTDHVVSGRAKG